MKIKNIIQNNKINIQHFGDYRLGLTTKEIKEYLKIRTGKRNIEELYKKFVKVAGVNTMGVTSKGIALMYRWDVKRFTDKLLLETPTYWD